MTEVAIVDYLGTLSRTIGRERRPDPIEGSPQTDDCRFLEVTGGDARHGARVVACADLWLVQAADHLEAVGLLVGARKNLFPLYPLLRAVVELSTTTYWLLAPDQRPLARLARGACVELRTYETACEAARMENDPAAGQRARQALKSSRRDIRAYFCEPFDDDEVEICGQRFQEPTSRLSEYGERWGVPRTWLGVYSYLCGMGVHPSLLGFELGDGQGGFQLPAELASRLIQAGVVPFLKAFQQFCVYMGWPEGGVIDLMGEANKAFGREAFVGDPPVAAVITAGDQP